MSRNTVTIFLGILVVVNVIFFFDVFHLRRHDEAPPQEAVVNRGQAYIFPVSEPTYIPIRNDGVPEPSIDARAALVYDTRSSRFLFMKNSRAELPIASLTKLLSALVVIEHFDLNDVVTVPQEAIRVDAEKQDLYLGERINVGSLLELMLVQSSNDAAYALAFHAQEKGIDFVAAMNAMAAKIGMVHSQFLDPAGLSDLAHSSPEDLVRLVQFSLGYPQIWGVLQQEQVIVSSVDGGIKHAVKSTNQLFGVVPDIVGGKTGYTDGALGCMLLVVQAPEGGEYIVTIVLGSHDRFGDTQKLVEWTRAAYRWQ